MREGKKQEKYQFFFKKKGKGKKGKGKREKGKKEKRKKRGKKEREKDLHSLDSILGEFRGLFFSKVSFGLELFKIFPKGGEDFLK
jgi:hypothetical protein